jgi:hypothetical protein
MKTLHIGSMYVLESDRGTFEIVIETEDRVFVPLGIRLAERKKTPEGKVVERLVAGSRWMTAPDKVFKPG